MTTVATITSWTISQKGTVEFFDDNCRYVFVRSKQTWSAGEFVYYRYDRHTEAIRPYGSIEAWAKDILTDAPRHTTKAYRPIIDSYTA